MKTYIGNVAILDMRKSTEESVDQIECIKNVGVVMISPATRPLLSRINIDNLGSVVEVGGDVEPSLHNGSYTLSELRPPQKVFIMVNGSLTVDESLDPTLIGQCVVGGMVNGSVRATQRQLAALTAAGVSVNGSSIAYPDGAKLRDSRKPLTQREASAMEHPLYLTRRVLFEEGAAAALAEKGLAVYGNKGAVILDKDSQAFYRVWQGTGSILEVPSGYTVTQGDSVVNRAKALLLRGQRYILGDLILREDVTEASLADLTSLIVTGRMFVPEALLRPLLEKLSGEPELIPYEGALLQFSGVHTLTQDAIDMMPEKAALLMDGVLQISGKIPPLALKERLTLLYVDGLLQIPGAHRMALLPVILGSGNVQTQDLETEREEEDSPTPEGLHVIKNASTYVI